VMLSGGTPSMARETTGVPGSPDATTSADPCVDARFGYGKYPNTDENEEFATWLRAEVGPAPP
jgi:hypothetical protein